MILDTVSGREPQFVIVTLCTALVEPSVRAAHGSGTQRLYSFRDILVLKVIKRLLDSGLLVTVVGQPEGVTATSAE